MSRKSAKQKAEVNVSTAGPAHNCHATITGIHHRATDASAVKEKPILDIVKAFTSANTALDA